MNDRVNATSDYTSDQLIEEYSVHLPDTIQPYGVLLSLDKTDFSILQISTNSEAYLGLSPQQLLGQSLDTLMDVAQIRAALQHVSPEHNRVISVQLSMETAGGVRQFDSFVHPTDTTIILEMEPLPPSPQGNFLSVHTLTRETIFQIQQTKTLPDLFNILVRDVRALTGFDRVHVYRFDEQGAGEVIAEAKHDELQSFLGLHFPEQDIPAPIREFYAKGKLRIIPDLQAERIPLTPAMNPRTGEPLDVTLSVLRSAHPCCIEYYQNMGTSAALVISLIKDHKLWGLLSCHHTTEKYVSYEVRSACELLTQMAALEMSNKVRQDDFEQQARIHALQSELIGAIAQADNFIDALIRPQERLLTLVNASGAAICLGDRLTLIGATPTEQQVQAIIDWGDREITDTLFYTRCLSDIYPDAETLKETASGLLMLRISRVQHYLILWFRPEVLQSVNWAGNPQKVTTRNEEGHQELCPRASFEHWQELVHASSLPW
ncbi:MAG: GAF domain-containing protein, partial [Leptolyngbyaceae bacterium]|nr:GAF domain-containing protein [Leptolyngbyaceae bacterium]